MTIDVQKLSENKIKIIEYIKLNGPSLPVHISRAINSSPLFTSAFLSELYSEKKIKMTNLRIGSSPLYYLEGQEEKLENFIEHLNQREKEAFILLKSEKVLEDEKQTPVIRVALRAIKDFAIQVRVVSSSEQKNHWKYYLIKDEEVESILNERKNKNKEDSKEIKINFESSQKIENPEKIKEPIKTEQVKNTEKEIESIFDKEVKKESNRIKEDQEKNISQENNFVKEDSEKLISKEEINLIDKVKEYLEKNNITLIELYEQKKKELSGKVEINTIFGKKNIYLIGKDKKKINETDITLAIQKAQNQKMQPLLITLGTLDKKAQEYLKEWGNMIDIVTLN